DAFGTLTFVSGGTVSISEDDATDLSGASSAATLNLTSGGHISDGATGTVTVSGTATLTAGTTSDDITLDNANNFGTVSIVKGHDVTLNDTNGIILGTSTVSHDLVVTAAGTITDSGNLSVTGNAKF